MFLIIGYWCFGVKFVGLRIILCSFVMLFVVVVVKCLGGMKCVFFGSCLVESMVSSLLLVWCNLVIGS